MSQTTIPIVFNGVTVNFPISGTAPNWAEAVIQSMQLISEALAISVGPFDVPPQNFVMTSNVNTNVDIPNLTFPVSKVQGAVIFYGVHRSTNSVEVSQSGFLILNYDPSRASGLKWQLANQFTNTGASVAFNVTDVGQVQFSTTSIAGTSHVGAINYRALAVLNS